MKSRAGRDEVEELLRDVIGPLVRADGGTIALASCSEDVVVVQLGGACAGCPGFEMTRTDVVEPLLRRYLGDEVRLVVRNTLTRMSAA